MKILSLVLSFLIVLLIVGLHKGLFGIVSRRINRRNANNDPKRSAPYPTQPIKGRERYRVMMDIRKLDEQNWLTVDKNYMSEHQIRGQLLEKEKGKVLQCLPESHEACQEALVEVVEFLCERFSSMFEMKGSGDERFVHNTATGETFAVQGEKSNPADALEIAVRLTMEDLSILMTNEDDEYYLAASASLFPVGWTVDERIGWTIARLHSPVPLWQQQVASSVSKFLARLTPTSPMERSNYFVEVKRPDENLLETLYRPNGLNDEDLNPLPQDIVIRRERQTFRRLPRTGAILFGVKTVLTTLDELPMQELQNFAKEIKSWPDGVGQYKGKQVWGAKVMEFYEKQMALQDTETVEV